MLDCSSISDLDLATLRPILGVIWSYRFSAIQCFSARALFEGAQREHVWPLIAYTSYPDLQLLPKPQCWRQYSSMTREQRSVSV